MTEKTAFAHPISQAGSVRERPLVASKLFISLIPLCSAILFIPWLPLRAGVIIALGGLIFVYERHLRLPVPVTPGTMLWLGNALSYVVGGLGSMFLYDGPSQDFGLPYLNSALLYLGLGLAAYLLALWLVGQLHGPAAPSSKASLQLNFHPISIWLIAASYIVPILIKSLLPNAGIIGVYNNLVVGALQSIQHLPMIILAFFLMRPGPRWEYALLLLIAALAIPWEGILLGYGRNKVPFALVAVAFTWLSLRWYSGQVVSRRAKVFLMMLPLASLFFFGASTAYRRQVQFNPNYTPEERLAIAEDSTRQFAQSGTTFDNSVGPLVQRLVELPSIELLGWAESGLIERAGWNVGDSKQVLFAWIPKSFFPEKGEGYGRDIMEHYGLCASWNNIPVTVLTDVYRRFGVGGVLGLYFLMGVFSTLLALSLLPRWGSLGLVLFFFFALQHLALYSSDVLEVFWLYVYRLPSSGLVIFLMLRFLRIWQPESETTKR